MLVRKYKAVVKKNQAKQLRRINLIDKKGMGQVKLLGKWDIHTVDEALRYKNELVLWQFSQSIVN